MKKAIIVGASSGIGRELAKILSENGYIVGLAARRKELLVQLKEELPNNSFIKRIDVCNTEEAIQAVQDLINEMGQVDLIVINAGYGLINPKLDLIQEIKTIDVNVIGFTAMANVAFKYFKKMGIGHIVGISSLAAIRGASGSPAYNASKAYISNYLQGLRQKASQQGLPILITDIKPGFVDTPMAQGSGLFWVAPVPKAAEQIYKAIAAKKTHAYITKRWRIIAWIFKIIPDWVYHKL
ncbi:MAG: SDR family NAD(P)-dependent oxidoreductase [Clostridia bacterium]|nr:SDR family NAD(P)-dependent oxidoreductase [Clostridia bacterium]